MPSRPENLSFTVRGSSPDPYTVTVRRADNGRITASCTCPAGVYNQLCKHRIRILNGSNENITHGTKHLDTVCLWIRGSELEAAVAEIVASEQAIADTQAHLKKQKALVNRLIADD